MVRTTDCSVFWDDNASISMRLQGADFSGASGLTEEQRAIVTSINQSDIEVERCKHLIAICQTARQAYINDLGNQLNSGDVGEEEV